MKIDFAWGIWLAQLGQFSNTTTRTSDLPISKVKPVYPLMSTQEHKCKIGVLAQFSVRGGGGGSGRVAVGWQWGWRWGGGGGGGGGGLAVGVAV